MTYLSIYFFAGIYERIQVNENGDRDGDYSLFDMLDEENGTFTVSVLQLCTKLGNLNIALSLAQVCMSFYELLD